MISMLFTLALAQDTFENAELPPINAQHFRPTIDGRRTLWTDDSARGEHKKFFVRPLIHYTRQPLVYRFENDETVGLVNNVLQADLMGGFSYQRLRVGVDVPIYLYADGDNQPSAAGLGDIQLDGKFSLLDAKDDSVGVALNGRVFFPSGLKDIPLGSRNTGWEAAVIVDKEFGDFLLAGNIGYRGGPRTELENVLLNDFLIFRAAGGYAFSEDSGAALEFAGDIPFSANAGAGLPLEVMLDGYTKIAPGMQIRGGLGTGLTSGVASPDFRVLLGFTWTPEKDDDRDNDGIPDGSDKCPDEPEDMDGEMDQDGCPEDIGTVAVRVVDQDGQPIENAKAMVEGTPAKGKGSLAAELASGEYTAKAMADGYEDGMETFTVVDADEGKVVTITLTKVAMGMLKVRVVDADGAEVPATLMIGDRRIESGNVEQSLPPGDYKVKAVADGYKSLDPQNVTLTKDATEEIVFTVEKAEAELKGDRIDLRDSVYFDTNKATIQKRSYELLDDVVGILGDHPELTRIRIEGHTDSRGSASYNKSLSQRRADSVRAFLIEKGIAPDRLEAAGFGEEKPIDPANNAAAWEKNRRVDFFVSERSD